jgi:hypothetical protein
MTKFKPGFSGNAAGRPRNAQNKLRKELRETIKDILIAESENIPKMLEKMEPDKRVKIFVDLLQFILSKPRDMAEPLEPADPPKEGFYELMMKRYNSLKQSGSSIKPIKVETVDFDDPYEFPRN